MNWFKELAPPAILIEAPKLQVTTTAARNGKNETHQCQEMDRLIMLTALRRVSHLSCGSCQRVLYE
jgi:hypothetical protein